MSIPPYAPTSPEVRLVLACLRSRYDPQANDDAIGGALHEPIDADRLLEVAERHAVTPLVHATLEDHRSVMGAPITEALDARVEEIRLGNLGLVGELLRLVGALRAEGIDVVPYKGPMAAQGLYGDFALREFVDLDLLVRPRDVRHALRILRSRGYEDHVPVTDRQLSFLLRSGHDRKLVRDDTYVVEIQWAIAARAEGVPLDPEPLLQRATEIALGGQFVRTLSKLDECLVLSIHGSLHLWGRLSWVCDIAEATRRLTDDEAANVLRAAEAARARRTFLSGPAMASRLTGVALPRPFASALDRDPTLVHTVESLMGLLLRPSGPEPAGARDHLRSRLALADGLFDRLRLAGRTILTPTLSDWHAIRLPDAAWPLYYPIRVVRLFGSYVARDRRPGAWLRERDDDDGREGA